MTKDDVFIRQLAQYLTDATNCELTKNDVMSIAKGAMKAYLFMLQHKADRLNSGAIGEEKNITFVIEAK